jgi:3-oxoacyl-[acyl-carrier-protein] synthase-1
MIAAAIAILKTGLVTSVGLSAPASCAAFRAKISNPSETRFIDSGGQWIMAHQVPLEQPWRGLTKLAKMAAMALREALEDVPQTEWGQLPLLLCVAENERPGRLAGLDDALFLQIQTELGVEFDAHSAVITQGRVGVAVALAQARLLIPQRMAQTTHPRVVIVATDSLLTWPTLSHFEQNERLLTERNSNGFMPGEAAGALLVGPPSGKGSELLCTGIGFGRELAHIDSEEPLRADGLTQAIKAALHDAGCQMHDMDFRITDLAGEQYYFKEATLALSRTLRQRKASFDIWHPAECTGEIGAAAGAAIISTAQAACQKNYTQGHNILAHMANDAGQRSAISLQYREAS